jgi:hypothetical protein
VSKFRYIAIAPGRVDGIHVERMGQAIWLHDFLIDHQTSADGRVNYGRPISYQWIVDRFANPPPVRSLQRWMSKLKFEGYISARRLSWGQGIVVRILKAKKWSTPPVQLSLFPPEDSRVKRVETVEKQNGNERAFKPPHLAVTYRHKWRFKDLEERCEETINPPLPPLPPAPAGEQLLLWGRETIVVEMGRCKRIPNLEKCVGGRGSDVVAFLSRKGLRARIVGTG